MPAENIDSECVEPQDKFNAAADPCRGSAATSSHISSNLQMWFI